MQVTLTTSPVAVSGITAGSYRIQNQSVYATVFAAAAESAPSGGKNGLQLPRRSGQVSETGIKVKTGESLYIWPDRDGSAAWIDALPGS